MITKKATIKDKFRREWEYTESARDAWSQIIEIYKKNNPNGKILLPSYIGWSANEGSGIFDSVVKSGLDFDFYSMGLHLEIDFENLKAKVSKDKSQLVLLVHYFGFTDLQYDVITCWLEQNSVFFVEDCAHALLSDLIGGICGRKGLFSFYSLHKILPVPTGGLIVDNCNSEKTKFNIYPYFDFSYDLFSIYSKRRSNYIFLKDMLNDIYGVDVIHKDLKKGICPQTLPVIVENFDRTTLYNKMNEMGFGMVSLYHTMISQLDNHPSEASCVLSKKIINFPIHQDVNENDILEMVTVLKKILNA